MPHDRSTPLRRAGHSEDAERSHRAAVVLSWRRVRSAAQAQCAAGPALESTLPAANANLAAAMHNLARVQEELGGARRVRLARADRLYRRAAALAPTSTRAAIHYGRGRMLDGLSRPLSARESYQAALTIEPENPVYWAAVASGYAAVAENERVPALREQLRAKAGLRAQATLHALAPIYRRTLELHHPPVAVELRDATLETLRHAHGLPDDAAERARIKAIEALWDQLEEATARRDAAALRRLLGIFDTSRTWEREQVQIALARTLGRRDEWAAAAREYAKLIAMLGEHRQQGIAQHSLHAKHARALRNAGRPHDALIEATRGQLQDPLSASARREVGKAHFALLQFEEELEAWKHTLWLTPNDPVLHWKVAFCHWNVAQECRHDPGRRAALAAAAERFEHAAALFGAGSGPGWTWSRLWAGRVMAELRDKDEAVRYLRTAAGCTPTAMVGSLLLGELHRERGEHDTARTLLDQAYKLACAAPAAANADADWGETLPVRDILTRSRALQPTEIQSRRAA